MNFSLISVQQWKSCFKKRRKRNEKLVISKSIRTICENSLGMCRGANQNRTWIIQKNEKQSASWYSVSKHMQDWLCALTRCISHLNWSEAKWAYVCAYVRFTTFYNLFKINNHKWYHVYYKLFKSLINEYIIEVVFLTR